MISGRRDRTQTTRYSEKLDRPRNGLERAFDRLKIDRAIATRYDKLASSFPGMLHAVAIGFWRRFVHTVELYLVNQHA